MAKAKPRGKPFAKGRSGNPAGLSRQRREERRLVKDLLDKALGPEANGGNDLLIDALKDGVRAREPALVKLSCEYRWGKPVTEVEVAGSLDLGDVSEEEVQHKILEIAERLRSGKGKES